MLHEWVDTALLARLHLQLHLLHAQRLLHLLHLHLPLCVRGGQSGQRRLRRQRLCRQRLCRQRLCRQRLHLCPCLRLRLRLRLYLCLRLRLRLHVRLHARLRLSLLQQLQQVLIRLRRGVSADGLRLQIQLRWCMLWRLAQSRLWWRWRWRWWRVLRPRRGLL